MIVLPCLAPYLVALENVNTHIDTPRLSRYTQPIASGGFSIENVFTFALYQERAVSRYNLLAQSLQLIETSRSLRITTLCEADYALPRSLGTIARSGTRVNSLADDIGPELRALGWSDPYYGLADMGAVEVFVSWRLYASESMHEWNERIIEARPLFDGLARAGCDIRPDLERFLSQT